MSRPTEEGMQGAHDTTGFSPSATPTTQLNVVAPLDVDAAPQQAMALAKALGHANEVAQPAMEQMQRQQGAADEGAGETAARLGAATPEDSNDPASQTLGFATGYAKAKTQQTALQAAAEAKQYAAANATMPLNSFTDDKGVMQPGLMNGIDAIYAKYFPNGAEKNPETAKAMSPILQSTFNEIVGQRNLETVRNMRQTMEDTQTGLLSHSIETGQQWDMQGALADIKKGYPNDDRGALSALVHVVGEAAVNQAKPEIVRQLLPTTADFGGGVRLTPQDQAYLDQASNRALEAQTRVNSVAAKHTADGIADTMLSGQDPTAQLHTYLKMPGANATEALDMYNWYYRSTKQKEADSVDNNAAAWEMDRRVASGDITNGGQIISFLTDQGVGNTKAGNQLLQRGMSNLRAFQNTNADDPDYRAGIANIAATYNPARDPITQKFLHESANAQQAGAMLDYRTLYNSFIRQPNTSSSDAARKAQQSVTEKWGDAIEDPHGNVTGSYNAPKSDNEQAAIIRASGSNPAALHAAGITGRDLNSLRSSGQISFAEASQAAEVLLSKHK